MPKRQSQWIEGLPHPGGKRTRVRVQAAVSSSNRCRMTEAAEPRRKRIKLMKEQCKKWKEQTSCENVYPLRWVPPRLCTGRWLNHESQGASSPQPMATQDPVHPLVINGRKLDANPERKGKRERKKENKKDHYLPLWDANKGASDISSSSSPGMAASCGSDIGSSSPTSKLSVTRVVPNETVRGKT